MPGASSQEYSRSKSESTHSDWPEWLKREADDPGHSWLMPFETYFDTVADASGISIYARVVDNQPVDDVLQSQ